MKKNLGAAPMMFPQPVLIIATYDENGKANAMNAAWGGIVGMDKIIIDLSSHKMKKAGFTTTKSEFVDAPVINELPVALECELIKVIDGNMYLGKIVNVAADESVLSEEGKITLSKFNPITFDTSENGYYTLGDRVGNAFKDGKKLDI